LIFGPYVLPLPSGTLARSRGIETIETVFPTGSSETTISESVRASVRPGAESIPIRRTFRRCPSFGSGSETERTVDPEKMLANIAWAAVPAFQTRRWGVMVTTARTSRPTAPSLPGRRG
jgi:hypothetical protein